MFFANHCDYCGVMQGGWLLFEYYSYFKSRSKRPAFFMFSYFWGTIER